MGPIITQAGTEEWRGIKCGRFTASTFGDLLAEPRSIPESVISKHEHLVDPGAGWKVLKSGARKGLRVRVDAFNSLLKEAMADNGIVLFGDTALSLIASKAAEALNGRPAPSVDTRSTDRGTLLEHAARILLSRHWRQIDTTHFQEIGSDGGATTDGLFTNGEPWQCKCPEDPGDLLLFDTLVQDGDFDALAKYDRRFAWQIMVEAYAVGAKYANITMFSDRLPLTTITREEFEEVQTVMQYVGHILGEIELRPIWYNFASHRPDGDVYGFHHVSKRFELTQDRVEIIKRTLAAAVQERDRIIARARGAVLPYPPPPGKQTEMNMDNG